MKKWYLITAILITGLAHGQLSEADSIYAYHRDILIRTGENSRILPTQEMRNAAADSFLVSLGTILHYPDAMKYEFSGVSNLSIINSEDDQVRLVTYMVPQRGGIYKHFGHLLYLDENDEYHHVPLKDDAEGNTLYKPLRPNSWYGGLYYGIIEKEVEDRTVYFLLGYRSVNPAIHQKFVDVLDLSDQRVQFGLPVFHVVTFNDIDNNRAPYRLTMSYGTKYSALMQWNEDYEGIVMDHVVPPDASQKGFYMVYGPDFTYDALVWKDEEWHLEKMITFGNEVETPAPGTNLPTGLSPAPQPAGDQR